MSLTFIVVFFLAGSRSMPLSAIIVDAMIKMVISKRFILMLLPCQVKDVGKSDELAVGGGAGLIF